MGGVGYGCVVFDDELNFVVGYGVVVLCYIEFDGGFDLVVSGGLLVCYG